MYKLHLVKSKIMNYYMKIKVSNFGAFYCNIQPIFNCKFNHFLTNTTLIPVWRYACMIPQSGMFLVITYSYQSHVLNEKNGDMSHWSPVMAEKAVDHRGASLLDIFHYDPRMEIRLHGPLARYVKSRFAYAPGMPGKFPPTELKWNRLLAISACITARAWRTCRDAWRDRQPAVAGVNVPGIPGACANHNFMYLARDPWSPEISWWWIGCTTC